MQTIGVTEIVKTDLPLDKAISLIKLKFQLNKKQIAISCFNKINNGFPITSWELRKLSEQNDLNLKIDEIK